MHDWAFRELQEMLAHKAGEYGIRVEDVPLEFTIRLAQSAGISPVRTAIAGLAGSSAMSVGASWMATMTRLPDYARRVGKSRRDFPTAKNIGLELLTLPSGKRLDGLGDGHLGLKSGILNGNGDYTAHDPASSDRGPTDKPTTSVVGR